MTQSIQHYEERFQDRVDELLFLENKVEDHIKRLTDMNEHYRKVYEAVTKDISQKMIGVNESLKKINGASEKIADYMTHCDQHAKYTRNIFMSALLGSVIVIAATLWWSHHFKNALSEDRKEFDELEVILKNQPVLKRIDGIDYVRITEPKTADLYEDGQPLAGYYAAVWYKK